MQSLTQSTPVADTSPAFSNVFKVIKVLGAAIGLAGGFATLYFGTLSVFLKPMADSFAWSRGQTSAVIVFAMLGLAIGAPLVGQLCDKFSASRVIPISVLLFAAALFVIPLFPASPLAIGALSLLLGVLAAATTPAGYLAVLPKYFDKRLGLALGLAMFGLGIGTILAPIVAQYWISVGGWHYAYKALALAALIFGGVACLLLFTGQAPASITPAKNSVVSPHAALPGIALREAVRTWHFWLLAVILFVVSAAGLGATVHVVAMFVDRGLSADLAAKGVAIAGVGVMLGRVATGALMDVIHAPRIASIAFLLGTAGLGLIALNPSPTFAVMAMGALLFGFAIGTEGDFIPFLVRRYFGLKAFGAIFGTLFCAYSLGGVTGPILFGVAFDRFGGYTPALFVATAMCLIASIAVLALGPYRYTVTTSSKENI